MNQNMLLIALVVGALFFMRRPPGRGRWIFPGAQAAQPMPWTGGAGTGYGVDRWGDEG